MNTSSTPWLAWLAGALIISACLPQKTPLESRRCDQNNDCASGICSDGFCQTDPCELDMESCEEPAPSPAPNPDPAPDPTPDQEDPCSEVVCPEAPDGADVTCEGGSCVFGCKAGVFDANGDITDPDSDGCECAPTSPPDEVCDGVDNDCDGTTDLDENAPITETCYEGPAGTEGIGVCRAGIRECIEGRFGDCEGQTLPSEEVCDDIDNDCDELIDIGESFAPRRGPEPLDEFQRQILPTIAVDGDGSHMLIAWQETTAETPKPRQGAARWALLNKKGTVLRGPGELGDLGIQPAVAWDGEAFAVVWIQPGDSDVLMTTRIHLGGAVEDTTVAFLTDGPPISLSDPRLAVIDGDRLMLAWTQQGGCTNPNAISCVRLREISTDGFGPTVEVSDAEGILEAFSPSVAISPGDEDIGGVVAWNEARAEGSSLKWLVLGVDHAPQLQQRFGFELQSTDDAQPVALMGSSGGFLVYVDTDVMLTRQIGIQFIDDEGTPFFAPSLLTEGGQDKNSPATALLSEPALAITWIEQSVPTRVDLSAHADFGAPVPEPTTAIDGFNMAAMSYSIGALETSTLGMVFTASHHMDDNPFPRLHIVASNLQGDLVCPSD